MADTAIIVIDGFGCLSNLESEYEQKHSEWKIQCSTVHARFKKKTSRSTKNGKVYESTNWYEEQCGGGLKSVGKEEPDYTKYYPPEPKPPISFNYREYEGHVLLEEKDFTVILSVFKDCLVFRLEDCKNWIHPLYKNPQKAVDSVRKRGVSSARSSEVTVQKREPACIEDGCLGDGDCDTCEHNDECPVMGETGDE